MAALFIFLLAILAGFLLVRGFKKMQYLEDIVYLQIEIKHYPVTRENFRIILTRFNEIHDMDKTKTDLLYASFIEKYKDVIEEMTDDIINTIEQ